MKYEPNLLPSRLQQHPTMILAPQPTMMFNRPPMIMKTQSTINTANAINQPSPLSQNLLMRPMPFRNTAEVYPTNYNAVPISQPQLYILPNTVPPVSTQQMTLNHAQTTYENGLISPQPLVTFVTVPTITRDSRHSLSCGDAHSYCRWWLLMQPSLCNERNIRQICQFSCQVC